MTEVTRRAVNGIPTWFVQVPGREPVAWEGMTTAPVVLDEAALAGLSDQLLGIPLADVPAAAGRTLRCFQGGAGDRPPALILHSATSTTKGFEGDLADVLAGRRPYDVPGYLEARAVSLGGPADLAVGRVAPWREAVERYRVPALDIEDVERYYLSHALLVSAAADGGGVGGTGGGPAARAVAGWLREHPDCIVRMYALDVEMQILLLWLVAAAGLTEVAIEANAPAVSSRWNQKNHLHPDVAAASGLDVTGLDPHATLVAERAVADSAVHLGLEVPVLPGYTVRRAGREHADFVADLLTAAGLMRSRYGLAEGCLKPSEAGDGARIVAKLPLDDPAAVTTAATEAYVHGDDYLLEAQVEFLTFEAAGRTFIVSPSGHIRFGEVAPGLTAQLLHGHAWEGNVYFDEATAADVGVPAAAYGPMRDALIAVRDAFHGPLAAAVDSDDGLVTGGIDFAVGRVGGRFGDEVLVAAIDFNLSSHGAEYLRAFMDDAHVTDRGTYAASRVYRPSAAATLKETDAALVPFTAAGEQVRAVACVPLSWGMVTSTGATPGQAARHAFALVEGLVGAGLAT